MTKKAAEGQEQKISGEQASSAEHKRRQDNYAAMYESGKAAADARMEKRKAAAVLEKERAEKNSAAKLAQKDSQKRNDVHEARHLIRAMSIGRGFSKALFILGCACAALSGCAMVLDLAMRYSAADGPVHHSLENFRQYFIFARYLFALSALQLLVGYLCGRFFNTLERTVAKASNENVRKLIIEMAQKRHR
ncbi:MAG: hypothetical protein FWG12_05500 [Holophagaceae bacterium]|nr:hypothetical protein [Holophagaceae bacterium]